ncbi:MAG: glycine zipper 2TM domain-containing protein [Gammaproteobacteria bacterium]|nr:MAG: glycine zipper 2TM domain-containing protein [Gammaproteobacteria bacterium]
MNLHRQPTLHSHRSAALAGLLLAATLLPGPASAAGGFTDRARVIDVQPVYRIVRVSTPRRECWTEQVPVEDDFDDDAYYSYTPMILGGILGGVIGSEMGKGRGRDAAILAGTVLGGSIGRDIAAQGQVRRAGGRVRYTHREHCRRIDASHEERRRVGYRVTYRYRGHEFVTRMDHDPGPWLRVRVDVVPDE